MFGVLVLDDAVTPLAALGVVVAMVGGLWYAQERKRLSEAPRPRPAEVQDEKGALLSMEEGKASCGPTRASPSPRPAPMPRPLDHRCASARRTGRGRRSSAPVNEEAGKARPNASSLNTQHI
tara:strand:+ start:417 stop:782 length:366 start_codon:yes stop_codon:yes gene_type:complete